MFNWLRKLFPGKLELETKKLIKNSSWVFVSNLSKAALLFVKALVLTRFLGVKTYGDYLSVVALILTIQAFFNLNSGTAIIRYGAIYQHEKETGKLRALLGLGYLTAFSTQVLATLAVGCALFLFRIFQGRELDLEWPILIYAFALGSVFLDYVSESYIRLFYQFRLAAMLTVLMSSIDLLLTSLLLTQFSGDFGTFLFGMALIRIIIFVLYNTILLIRIGKLNAGKPVASPLILAAQFAELFRFTSTNYLSRLLKNLLEQGDVLLIGYFANQYQVGIYGVGKRVGYAILSVIDPLIHAVFPQLSHLIAQRQYSELKQMLFQFTKWLLLPISLLFVISFFFRSEIIVLLFGEAYRDAADTFIVVLLAALIASLTFWNTPLLLSLGEVRFRLVMNVVILAGCLLLAPLLIPQWGAWGAALMLLFIKCTEGLWGVQRCLVSLKKLG